MAKKSIILDNGDGRITFSNTSSVSIDDVTTNISASVISASSISLSGVSAGAIKILSASNGSFATFPDGIANGGAIAFDGTKWITSTIAPNDYIGTASGDLSGTFQNDIKVVNISNVSAGTLPVGFGGTGKSLTSGKNYVLKVSSSVGATPIVSSIQNISGSVLTTVSNKWISIPAGYPDVRFYTNGSSGNTFTWTKPSGARFARIILQGGGGGGGGSRQGASLYNGSGGGGGAFTDITIEVSNISSATITTGIGGIGGNNAFNAVPTSATAGGNTTFIYSSTTLFAGGGGGGLSGTANTGRAGGGGGTAMAVTTGGYSKAGGAGAPNGTAAGTPYYTGYGICGGGGAGGFYNSGNIISIIPSTCFEYKYTTDGIDISSLNFKGAKIDDYNINTTADYGVGGSASAAASTNVGGRSCNGGNGYAIVISW